MHKRDAGRWDGAGIAVISAWQLRAPEMPFPEFQVHHHDTRLKIFLNMETGFCSPTLSSSLKRDYESDLTVPRLDLLKDKKWDLEML